MKTNTLFALLLLGGIVLLANTASAVSMKPRPAPIVAPPAPAPEPVVSES